MPGFDRDALRIRIDALASQRTPFWHRTPGQSPAALFITRPAPRVATAMIARAAPVA